MTLKFDWWPWTRQIWGNRPSNLTPIGLKLWIFQPVWPWNLMDDLEKLYGTSSTLLQALCIISNPSNSNWSYCLETLNLGQNQWIFVPCDIEMWWRTWKNNRVPLLCYIKLSLSFQSHGWIQTGVTDQKYSIQVKIGGFCPMGPGNLTDDWLKTIGHLSNIKLWASFHYHMWIQTGVTAQRAHNTIITVCVPFGFWRYNLAPVGI